MTYVCFHDGQKLHAIEETRFRLDLLTFRPFFAGKKKDTVAAYKENDEVETGEHAETCNTAVGSNSIVHNGVPIFAS